MPHDRVPPWASPPPILTARHRQVIVLVATGHANKETARLLGLSVKTIETYRSQISQRLGYGDAASLTRLAIRMGWVDP